MVADIEIRSASERDHDALVRLAAAFRDHLGQSSPSEAEFRDSIAALLSDADTEFLVARDARAMECGYAQVRYRRSAWVGLQCELEDVFVVPELRRRGLGGRLVEAAIARAELRGCRSIGLNTNERNQAALVLYRRLGFISERPHWNGGRQLWLEKSLDPRA